MMVSNRYIFVIFLQFDEMLILVVIIVLDLALGTFPFGSNFRNIGGFTSGFLLGFVILTRRQHHWLNLNKSNTSQKQESYQYALRIISFVLLSVG